MRVPMRDTVATALVAAGVLIYAAWAVGMDLAGLGSVSVVTAAILVLGMAASALAVVPTFDDLIHGSKAYLVGASALGAGALVAGIIGLLQANAVALAVLALATVALWGLATYRHLGHGGPEAQVGPR
jgi:hypothetical protein